MSLKKTFNWLAQPPKNHLTLGQLFTDLAGRTDVPRWDDRRLNFTRMSRIWERTHTFTGMMAATLALATAPTTGMGLFAAAATLCFWKGLGVGMGKIVDIQTRDVDRYLNGPRR